MDIKLKNKAIRYGIDLTLSDKEIIKAILKEEKKRKEREEAHIKELKSWICSKRNDNGYAIEYIHISGTKKKIRSCLSSELFGGTCQCINHSPWEIIEIN